MLEYKKMDLYVKIIKEGPKYKAQVIGQEDPQTKEISELLETPTPLNRMLLEQLLESFGFHQSDIFDALNVEDGQSTNIKHPLW